MYFSQGTVRKLETTLDNSEEPVQLRELIILLWKGEKKKGTPYWGKPGYQQLGLAHTPRDERRRQAVGFSKI